MVEQISFFRSWNKFYGLSLLRIDLFLLFSVDVKVYSAQYDMLHVIIRFLCVGQAGGIDFGFNECTSLNSH